MDLDALIQETIDYYRRPRGPPRCECSTLSRSSLLVIAPHADDEVLGAGA